MAYWSVVNTQPLAERRTCWHLEWQGFTIYAPREKVTRFRKGKKTHTSRWLFPRYVFVWIEDRWHELFTTIGISRVLISSGEPAKVPNEWIRGLRSSERKGLIVLPKSRFRIGQRVEVIGGLLRGQHGLYQGMTSRQREVVLLEALGKVELASGDLAA